MLIDYGMNGCWYIEMMPYTRLWELANRHCFVLLVTVQRRTYADFSEDMELSGQRTGVFGMSGSERNRQQQR